MNSIAPKQFSSAGDFPPALVLNADYRPLSYFPLSLWGWQDVVKAVFLEREGKLKSILLVEPGVVPSTPRSLLC